MAESSATGMAASRGTAAGEMAAHAALSRMEPSHAGQRQAKTYLCIDLKTFYASVECADRGLDPFTTNLVVADIARGPSTICLAITPAMKALGIRNRCRLRSIPDGVDYIAARPRMRHYMEVSAKIYGIYLRYVSPEDVHVYSIDECFIDATPYLALYDLSPREFALTLMGAVREETGIFATAGIGTNLFLAKVALDITAKHVKDGIGMLDEERFKRLIWPHRPITDIWGIGAGTAQRLARYHVGDLQGVAALNEDILYREFGVNAEYLIDHAHGREPCTIAQIRAYRPASTSISNGQVLYRSYTWEEALTVLHEMVDTSVLELVEKGLVAGGISLFAGYDMAAGSPAQASPTRAGAHPAAAAFEAAAAATAPRPDATARQGGQNGRRSGWGGFAGGGGQRRLSNRTNSMRRLWPRFRRLFQETVDARRGIRRLQIGFGDLLPEEFATFDLFTDMRVEQREHDLAHAVIDIKRSFGKNALIRGMSLKPEATGRERNEQVGGHHA